MDLFLFDFVVVVVYIRCLELDNRWGEEDDEMSLNWMGFKYEFSCVVMIWIVCIVLGGFDGWWW